jgi:hypothetical protein
MARPRSVVGALALLLLLASPAGAQGLRTLHVDAFSMRADRTRIALGATFHVAIHVHVRERIAALDELEVPNIGTMQPLGDERTVSHANGGTDIVETLTLAPTQVGSFTFERAYFDAIDGRTGRPSRFSSNPLRVDVVAGVPTGNLVDATLGALRDVLLAVGAFVALAVVLLVGVAVVRIGRARRRAIVRVAAPVAPPPPPPVEPVRTPRDEVAAALRRYRSAPANGALRGLRAALFVAAGAAPGATLRDALATTDDGALRLALSAAERAAFGPAAGRDAASDELVAATQRWLQ